MTKVKDYKNPGGRTFSNDSDDSYDDAIQEPRRASRQSSVTGSENVEMLIGEITGDKDKKENKVSI